MLSIDIIRNNPKEVEQGLARKGEKLLISEIIKLDESYRSDLAQANEMRAERNVASDKIARAKKLGENSDKAINAMRKLSQQIKVLEEKTQSSKNELDQLLLGLPNIPHESVPEGKDEKNNQLVREWGETLDRDFNIIAHLELAKL
jgi:seryl-tRNA synthetase